MLIFAYKTLTNVAFTTVQWLWLKEQFKYSLTDQFRQHRALFFSVIIMKGCWMFFFLFFFLLNLTKSRLVKVEHSILTSHTEDIGKNVAVRKRREPGVDCVYKSSEMHVRGVMQIQGCWGKQRPGLFQRIKKEVRHSEGCRLKNVADPSLFLFFLFLSPQTILVTQISIVLQQLWKQKKGKKNF